MANVADAWQPATELERRMDAALYSGSQEAYFRLLADAELVVPVAPELVEGVLTNTAQPTWPTSQAEGRTNVLVYTSVEAMRACTGGRFEHFMRLRFGDIAASWPDPRWWLMVDAGLPIQGHLPSWFVRQIAEGDARPPLAGTSVLPTVDLPAGAEASPAEGRPGAEQRTAAAPPAQPVAPQPSGAPQPGAPQPSAPQPSAPQPAGTAQPAATAQPGPGFEPANDVERALLEAIAKGDENAFVRVLSGAEAIVPVPQDMDYTLRPGRPGFPWQVRTSDGRTVVPLFTSPERMRDAADGPAAEPVPGAADFVTFPFATIMRYWPDQSWDLLVNPGGPVAGSVPGVRLSGMADWADQQAARRAADRFEAQNEVERRLFDAAVRDDADAFFQVLLSAQVLVPTEPDTPWGIRPDDPEFPWHALPVLGRPAVQVFTSLKWMHEAIGSSRFVMPNLVDIVTAWPDPEWTLVINPGTPVSSIVPGERVRALAASRPPEPAAPQPAAPQAAELRPSGPQPAVAPSGPQPTAAPSGPQPTAAPSGPQPTAAPSGPTPSGPQPVAAQHPSGPQVLGQPPVSPPAAAGPSVPVPGTDAGGGPEREPAPRREGLAAVPDPAATARTASRETAMEPVRAPAQRQEPPAVFEAGNRIDQELYEAAVIGDTDAFLRILLAANVLIPIPSDAPLEITPIQQGFRWDAAMRDPASVQVFTSLVRLRETLLPDADEAAPPPRFVYVDFKELISCWPRAEWKMLLNPGTRIGASLQGEQVHALSEWAARVGLVPVPPAAAQVTEPGETEPFRPTAPVPAPAAADGPDGHRPASAPPERLPVAAGRPYSAPPPQDAPEPAVSDDDAPAQPTVMQKVVHPAHVSWYLEQAYDRVGGFVHPAADVSDLQTPVQLYHALGLLYEGGPFTPDDEGVYVIRWPAYCEEMYRIPFGGQSEDDLRPWGDAGWVVEKPPFIGNGFAAGSAGTIREFKVDSARLPYGAEMYYLGKDRSESFVAVYDPDRLAWLRPEPAMAQGEPAGPGVGAGYGRAEAAQ